MHLPASRCCRRSASSATLSLTFALLSLPPPVRDFLTSTDVVLVGAGWGRADERKMRASFDMGRSDFAYLIDLQVKRTLADGTLPVASAVVTGLGLLESAAANSCGQFSHSRAQA
jgi:hypothetical protein